MSVMDGLPWWVSPLWRGGMPSLCDFLHQAKQQKSSLETVITAATTHWCDKKADNLTNGHGIHFNYTLSSENAYQYHVTANKSKQLEINQYFDQFYQIWDEYMWVTPEKGQLVRIAEICWEQDVHIIGYNIQKMDKNNLKPMDFLQIEQCHKTYKVTYYPNQSTPMAWNSLGFQLQDQVDCS